jgi:hypothetical protein
MSTRPNSRQRLDCLGLRHFADLAPNVADLLSVDRPHGQRVVLERNEQSFQLIVGCGRFAEPLRPVLLCENERHPIVQRADKRVGRTGDDGAALDPLASLLVRPLVPQAGHHHVALVSHRNRVGLLLGLLPFIEAVLEMMYRWRISIFGETPARSLGTIIAPDNEPAARAKGIEFFHIEDGLKFRVVATKLEKVKGPRELA